VAVGHFPVLDAHLFLAHDVGPTEARHVADRGDVLARQQVLVDHHAAVQRQSRTLEPFEVRQRPGADDHGRRAQITSVLEAHDE
jgi:hypothetical protein